MNKLITLGTVSGETKVLPQEAVLFPDDGKIVVKVGRILHCASQDDIGEPLPQCQL